MRFKLDENITVEMSQPLTEAGHDAATASGEGISGCDDQSLYELCRAEQRVLVTLDMDFANPLRFPPEATAGVIVLRPPRPLLSLLRSALANALATMQTESTTGKLWIVEPANIRIYEPDSGLTEAQGLRDSTLD